MVAATLYYPTAESSLSSKNANVVHCTTDEEESESVELIEESAAPSEEDNDVTEDLQSEDLVEPDVTVTTKKSKTKSSKITAKSDEVAKPKVKSDRANKSSTKVETKGQCDIDEDYLDEEPSAKSSRTKTNKSSKDSTKSNPAARLNKTKAIRKTSKSEAAKSKEIQQSDSEQSEFEECSTKNTKIKSRAAVKPKFIAAAKPRTARERKKSAFSEDHEEERYIKDYSGGYHEKNGFVPFGFQSAKTSRANCNLKSCKIIKIDQGTIKFCEFKGKQVVGFHVGCVSNEQKAKVLRWVERFNELEGYDLLDNDDISHLKKL